MPFILKHSDKIAREKNRDILLLRFSPTPEEKQPRLNIEKDNYDNFTISFGGNKYINQILNWFISEEIPWEFCLSSRCEGVLVEPYDGYVYIDVPYDINNATFLKLNNYLENPDGSMRWDGVGYYYLELSMAMKNAHHDVPGFDDLNY